MLKLFRDLSFKKRLFLNIGSATITVIVLLVVYYLIMISIADSVEQIQEKRKSLMLRSAVLASEASLKTDWSRVQKESLYLDNVFPPADELIEFPRDISVWASRNNLDVGFSFVKEVGSINDEPSYITFILISKGSLSDISNFLRSIEASRYLVQYDQYDLVSEDNIYTLLINGKIFSR